MNKLMTRQQGQRGFTLIELIVVIAIMGVLAAVTAPTITSHLGKSRERSFTAEGERIQSAVNGFVGAPDNVRFLGKRQFPLLGRNQTDETVLVSLATSTVLTDQGNPFKLGETVGDATSTDIAIWNPVGGTEGSDLAAKWTDGEKIGVRRVESGSSDRWSTVDVVRGGVTYVTDPRYFFIDFEVLVEAGLLQSIPGSASLDNRPEGSTESYTGSYIWYLDDKGEVRSLHVELPSTGSFVDGVFP